MTQTLDREQRIFVIAGVVLSVFGTFLLPPMMGSPIAIGPLKLGEFIPFVFILIGIITILFGLVTPIPELKN